MTDSNRLLDDQSEQFFNSMNTQVVHDRYFKRLGVAGWAIATVAMVMYGMVSFQKFMQFWTHAGDSPYAMQEALNQLVPFLGALGGVGVLLAVLAASALIMRTRSASLNQLSQRLTNIEEIIIQSSN